VEETRSEVSDPDDCRAFGLCRSQGFGSECKLIPVEGNRLGVVGAYLLTALEAAAVALRYKRTVFVNSATDILPDVIPGFLVRFPYFSAWNFASKQFDHFVIPQRLPS